MEQIILDNEQVILDRKQIATKNKELEKKYSHLETKYDKLIELYDVLTSGAGNDISHYISPTKSSTRSNTSPKQHKNGRKSKYIIRDFVNYPQTRTTCTNHNIPARANMVCKDALADELTCRTCPAPYCLDP